MGRRALHETSSGPKGLHHGYRGGSNSISAVESNSRVGIRLVVRTGRLLHRLRRLVWQAAFGGGLVRQHLLWQILKRIDVSRELKDRHSPGRRYSPPNADDVSTGAMLRRVAGDISRRLGTRLDSAHHERRELTARGREAFFNGEYDELTRIRAQVESLKEDLRTSMEDDVASLRVLGTDWSGPMGNLALIDQYLKLHILGLTGGTRLAMLSNTRAVANPHLFRLWQGVIPTGHAVGAELVALERNLWPICEQIEVRSTRHGILDHYRWLELADREWSVQTRGPLLQLDSEIIDRGSGLLRRWGLTEQDWFVAAHVRDAGTPGREVANADIDSYVDAFRAVTDTGGWVVRMGVPASKPLPRMERVIDYTQLVTRAPWMDVFLWARCRFFIGTASGPLSVPNIFGRPTLTTNSPVLALSFSFRDGLEVPKLLVRSGSERRPIALRKSLRLRTAWTTSNRDLGEDVDLRDCTRRHLQLAVLDMLSSERTANGTRLMQRATEIRALMGARGTTNYSPSFLEALLEDAPDFLD